MTTTRVYGERLSKLLVRQFGVVSWGQLSALGVTGATLQGWLRRGGAKRVLPRVYAIGAQAPRREAELWAAVLFAGPDAAISHATAAQWYGLIKYAPRLVDVSAPRERMRVRPGVWVHCQRRRERVLHNGVPVTTIPQTLLDLASAGDLQLVRRALAQLDFRNELDVRAIETVCGPGRPGSRLLRQALGRHEPRLAHTNGELEARFLEWCERMGLPLPECNYPLHGELADAYWPQYGLVVELDGDDNHSSRAQRHTDRRKEASLRAHGLQVVRYDWDLLHREPGVVYRDLAAQMRDRRLDAGAESACRQADLD